MEKDKVTVCVALFNNQNTIERCLNSVINQEYKNIEILVVDDGSTDESENVIRHFFDGRISIVKQENSGLSSVRQKGLELAHGKYICFIDGDDYLDSKYVQSLYEAIEENGSDVCICGTTVITESGEIIEDETNALSFNSFEIVSVTKEDLKDRFCKLLEQCLMSDSWNKLYSRSFLLEHDLRFELQKGFNGTDLIFNHKVLLNEPKIAMINERLYFHVLYKKSATHRKNKRLLNSMLIAMEQIINESKKNGLDTLIRNQLSNLYYLLVRNSLQDLFFECRGKKRDFIAFLKEIYPSLDEFNLRHGPFRLEDSISKSLKIFASLLSKKRLTTVYLYCLLCSTRERNIVIGH